MKILAVIASPKGKGNTYKTVKHIEETMKELDKHVEFEYLVLKDIDLQSCKGCFQCIHSGEQHCPIKDERAGIEEKMASCDGFVFASPVYVYNMSWIAKNFIDRLSYISHRPRFHGKKAMVVSTTGAVGLGFTLFTLAFPLKIWGFEIASKIGVTCDPTGKQNIAWGKKNEKAITKGTESFVKAIQLDRKPIPGIINLFTFAMQKGAFKKAGEDNTDYKYWKEQGWLEPETHYYCDVRINGFKLLISNMLAAIALHKQSTADQESEAV